MKIPNAFATAALIAALGLTLTACSADAETPAPTVTQSADPTVEPTAQATPETPPAAFVGDTIAADQIDTVREAGLSVYVSPNGGGEGLVVDPAAPLPEVVVADLEMLSEPDASPDLDAFSARGVAINAQYDEMTASGLSAFYIKRTGNYDADGTLTGSAFVVSTMNVPGARDFAASAGDTRSNTKAGAIANLQEFMDANPGVPLIDLAD